MTPVKRPLPVGPVAAGEVAGHGRGAVQPRDSLLGIAAKKPRMAMAAPPVPVKASKTKLDMAVSAPASKTDIVMINDKDPKPSKLFSALSSAMSSGSKMSASSSSSASMAFHVVFLIDISASMKHRDVMRTGGANLSRLAAVWDAVEAFVNLLKDSPDVVASVVLFNDKAWVEVSKRPLSGPDGLLKQMARLRGTLPRFGGQYLPALKQLEGMVDPAGVTVSVMLSDGRPGDGRPAIEQQMKHMQKSFGSKCILHTVMFGPEASGTHASCLENLASAGGGSYYANEQLDAIAFQRTFSRISASVSTLRSSVLAFGEKALRQIAKKEMEPDVNWKGREEEAKKPEISRPVTGHFMVPDKGGSELDLKRMVMKGTAREVFLHHKPFAEGAQRYAFHLLWWVPDKEKHWHFVVKRSKFEGMHDTPHAVHGFFLKNHYRAQGLAAEFNLQALKRRDLFGDLKVTFTPAYVVEIIDSTTSSTHYTTCERLIEGSYVKYSSNDGWVNALLESSKEAQIAAAFSHYSFQSSQGDELCVDIQGVDLMWTDPQLHSRDREFGFGDLGKEGMKLFFQTHKCNEFCKAMGLKEVNADTLEAAAAPKDKSCLFCMDEDRTVVNRPCGHLCLCASCHKDHPEVSAKCLVCQKDVKSTFTLNASAGSMRHSTYYERS